MKKLSKELPWGALSFFMDLKVKYIITIGVMIFYYMVGPSPIIYNTICLGLILLFGVPHGAADHRINATLHGTSILKYILKYLLIAGGFILWWSLMPEKAFTIFILLSAYHFGQEFLEDIELSFINLWEIMIWGSAILIAPILMAYQEINSYIEFVSRTNLPDIPVFTLIGLVSVIFGAAIVHLLILKRSHKIDAHQMGKQLKMLILLAVSFSVLPFLIAFTLYFILFHSLNAFKHQFTWLQSKISGYAIKSFIRDLSLFSFLSIFGIIILIYLIRPNSWLELIGYFFFMISVITLPHSLLFDQLYKFRSNPTKLD